MGRRIEQVNHLIRDELSDMLQREIKDPRLSSFISITEVTVSPDLHFARVLVSSIGGEADKKEILTALASAAGFMRHELVKRLDIKRVPDLQFEWDSSIEHGARVLELINKTSQESAKQG